MPRKKKDPVADAAKAAQEAPKTEKPETSETKGPNDPMQTLGEALGKALKENPDAVTEMLSTVLNVAQGSVRTVSEPPRKLKSQEPEKVETEAPAPPEGVIFKSPHFGFHQILTRSKKQHFGDDYEIIPPKIVAFTNGTARLDEQDEIDAMRRKIRWREKRGLPVAVIEVHASVAADLADRSKDVGAVKSPNVTVDTPLEELVS